jgi:hypothetical protein
MTLADAIPIVIARAVFDPSMAGCSDFESIEGMTTACDPVARGVFAAANNRAAVKRCATHGEWKACPEDVETELIALAAAGFNCGCKSGGACSLPVEEAAAGPAGE